jgi:hypothetical protein
MDKVILMDDHMTMQERIERAKQQAEEDYQNKVERSYFSDVDVRDFFADEELARILSNNEFFNGSVADLTKVQRHSKLAQAASWLNDHCMEVVSVSAEALSKSHPNGIVSVDLRRLGSVRGQELKVLTAMFALSDTVFFSNMKDQTIRFTFGVEGVWQE